MNRQSHAWQAWGAAAVAILLLAAGAWYGLGNNFPLGSRANATASVLTLPAPVRLSNAFSKIARRIAPTVVQVEAIGPAPRASVNSGHARIWPFSRERSLGSGLVVDARGFILTNAHVVHAASRVEVEVAGREYPYPGRIIGSDSETDLAVVRIFPRHQLQAAPLGNSRSLQVGDWVLALGSPFGLQNSVTAGIISALNRQLDTGHPLQKFIQTDAAINPGNSGGPLVDMAGQVVGINTAIDTDTGTNRGVGFALPSNLAIEVYNQLLQHGRVLRGSIGIYFQSHIGALVRRMYGWQGMPISGIVPGGPAARGGLQAGDIILAVNGSPIHNGSELSAAILHQPIGAWLRLDVMRGQHRLQLRVQVADRDHLFGNPATAAHMHSINLPKLGLLVTLRSSLPTVGLSEGQRGVWVSEVEPGSFADRVAVLPGDWITAINRHPVASLRDYRKILTQLHFGQPVVFALLRPGQGGKLEPWYTGGYYGQ